MIGSYGRVLIVCALMLLASFITYELSSPIDRLLTRLALDALLQNIANQTTLLQKVAIDRYVDLYCHAGVPSNDFDKAKQFGEKAALSFVTVRGGIGDIAYAEMLKCKAENEGSQ